MDMALLHDSGRSRFHSPHSLHYRGIRHNNFRTSVEKIHSTGSEPQKEVSGAAQASGERAAEKPHAATSLLSSITYPSDLRKLPEEQLPQLCREIRECIISNLSVNPGHFASSMGAVEITVALHYVFDTPDDRIVWDVGHQAYAHKILTGRREKFSTLRKLGGLSGFPNPLESEYDTFISGHASNSISAALGMAIADLNTPGHENRKTVAVVGDASISGGLAFEGLNNAANNPNNLLIILNDNDMSIDDNVGALHRYMTEMTTSAGYNRWRHKLYQFFRRIGLVNEKRRGMLLRLNNSLKAFISAHQNIFEGLNIRYFGPFDGHDVLKIVKVLREIKNMEGPRILHLRTLKGKGFEQAEKDPTTWHAPGKFDPETGERIKKPGDGVLNWQEVFGRTLVELAEADGRVCGVTAAMPSGTSMNLMLLAYPRRTFDVGISEGHAVTFAGGLASAGKRPFVAIYSSFLQRAYDNIIHDVCIQGLPVCFCIDRAGVVGEDGVTHHGMFDPAYLRCIPGLTIGVPSDEAALRDMMYTYLQMSSPMAIRYPRGKAFTSEWKTPMREIKPGVSRPVVENPEARIAVLTMGPIVEEAKTAAKELADKGVKVEIHDMLWLKPLDTGLLERLAPRIDTFITVEDASATGGLGSAVSEWCANRNDAPRVVTLGAPDSWVAHGTPAELKRICGYDAAGIVKAALEAKPKDEK